MQLLRATVTVLLAVALAVVAVELDSRYVDPAPAPSPASATTLPPPRCWIVTIRDETRVIYGCDGVPGVGELRRR